MKNWLIGALAVAIVATAVPSISEAKRLGGGGSAGMNRGMPARTAPDSVPAKPAQAPTAQPGTPAGAAAPAAAGTAAAAATAKRSWMGPIAGLAAGLGIAALMSHLGMGEAFGNFLMMALLAVALFFVVRFVMSRMAAGRASSLAPAGAAGGMARTSAPAWPAPAAERTTDDLSAPARPSASSFDAARPSTGAVGTGGALPPLDPVLPGAATAATAVVTEAAAPKVFVPATFDSESFTRTAKMIFIRLQAANDGADLDDLRRFTTPDLFAALRLDLQDRGDATQHTDVQQVDAEVLDVAEDDGQQIVSVRFTGKMVEDKGAAPISFDEVWHLVRPVDDSKPWAIAGIEQMR